MGRGTQWSDLHVGRIPLCTWDLVAWLSLEAPGEMAGTPLKDTVFSLPPPCPGPPGPPGFTPEKVHLGWPPGLLSLLPATLQLEAQPEAPFPGRWRCPALLPGILDDS